MTVTTFGSVAIEDSIFEATGAMQFTAQGGAPVTVRGNELRANNLLTYVADDPSVPVMLELAAGAAATKAVQGKRIERHVTSARRRVADRRLAANATDRCPGGLDGRLNDGIRATTCITITVVQPGPICAGASSATSWPSTTSSAAVKHPELRR
jgi:hypothetical protein